MISFPAIIVLIAAATATHPPSDHADVQNLDQTQAHSHGERDHNSIRVWRDQHNKFFSTIFDFLNKKNFFFL